LAQAKHFGRPRHEGLRSSAAQRRNTSPRRETTMRFFTMPDGRSINCASGFRRRQDAIEDSREAARHLLLYLYSAARAIFAMFRQKYEGWGETSPTQPYCRKMARGAGYPSVPEGTGGQGRKAPASSGTMFHDGRWDTGWNHCKIWFYFASYVQTFGGLRCAWPRPNRC